MDFVFMLTRNDRTVPDAMEHLADAQDLGLRHIGFKDVGLPFDQLADLNRAIRAGGATSYLEVVSLDGESEIASARAAVRIGVDVLLGGTRADEVLEVIQGRGIRYYPFPGRITGHPSVLGGPAEEVIASAARLAARPGVAGLDLLAWRLDSADESGIAALIAGVCRAAGKPVIVAGSIDRPERIAAARAAGATGFTVGTAALDGAFRGVAGTGLRDQLKAIRDLAQG